MWNKIKKYLNMFKNFNLFKKLKNIFNYQIVKLLLISFFMILITISIIFAVFWHYRSRVFNYIANNYITNKEISKKEPVFIEKVVEIPIAPIIPVEKKVEIDTVVTAVKKAKPAVVSIVVSKEVPQYSVSYKDEGVVYTPNGTKKQELGSGSGFLISSDGLIVTNRHVVDTTDAIYTVLLNNGKEYIATVLARDSVLDVAIIKINATNLPYLKFANSDQLEVGESVIAIGNALGEFKNTVSTGVVSGLSRSLSASGGSGYQEFLYKVIQTDAAINRGNSGGPLLNLKGEVVGINVALAQGSSNVGFSLPINSVKSVIDQVKKTGKISRPYVGIRYVKITPDLKAQLNLSVDYGVLVAKGSTAGDVAVIQGSPAEKAGIIENDIILSINGVLLNKGNDFVSIIRDKKIGEILKFKVLSNGVERIVNIKLEAAADGQ